MEPTKVSNNFALIDNYFILKMSRNSIYFSGLSVQLVFLRVLRCCLRLRPIRCRSAAALIIACPAPLQIANRAR